MKIIRLEAENVKRLIAVEIEPDGSVVKITGRNGAGKSSVLDSILWALGGGGTVASMPVRRGARKGRVEVTLGDGPDAVDYVVERTFARGKTYLSVKSASGDRIAKPQQVLDGLVGKLAFDPLEFLRLRESEQVEALRAATGLDLSQIDAEIAGARQWRSDTKRARDALERKREDLQALLPADRPTEPVPDVLDLIDRLEASRDADDRREAKGRDLDVAVGNCTLAKGAIREHEEAVEATRRRLVEAESEVERIRGELDRAINERGPELEGDARAAETALAEAERAVEEAPAGEDREAIQAEIGQVDALRREVEQWDRFDALVADLKVAGRDHDNAREALEALRERREATIREADLPIEDLSMSEDEVLYRGVPLAQASQAEQLRAAVALAMAMNPELRIVRITDGSLLDEDSFAQLAALAEDREFQIWIEVVDSSGESGIYIEDGHVAAVDGTFVGDELDATEGSA